MDRLFEFLPNLGDSILETLTGRVVIGSST